MFYLLLCIITCVPGIIAAPPPTTAPTLGSLMSTGPVTTTTSKTLYNRTELGKKPVRELAEICRNWKINTKKYKKPSYKAEYIDDILRNNNNNIQSDFEDQDDQEQEENSSNQDNNSSSSE